MAVVRKGILSLFTIAVVLSALHYHEIDKNRTVKLSSPHAHHQMHPADACELMHRFQNSLTSWADTEQTVSSYATRHSVADSGRYMPGPQFTLQLSARPPPAQEIV